MEQSVAPRPGGKPEDLLATTGLCLLSFDGGGVRGLSTLYILKGLMVRLSHERRAANLPAVKPCEVFDLIGGTSTGGLIAIMLGRLEMEVEECISAYSELMEAVFRDKLRSLPIGWKGGIKARFDSKRLKDAIDQVIIRRGVSKSELFNDGKDRGCRVFVCATAKETAGITRLRSYSLPDELDIPATICLFVDGALGANNPVDEIEEEASNVWCSETGDLKPLVKCSISIGTGNPGNKAIDDKMLKFLSGTLVEIATETEKTERRFVSRWRQHFDEKRYFRFNVEQGLQDVDLAEFKKHGTIEAVTDEYLKHMQQKFRVRDCLLNLKQKQNRTATSFAVTLPEYNTHNLLPEKSEEPPLVDFAPGEAPWTVPFKRNALFIGRNSQLDRLEKTLFAKDQTSKITIIGLGGVGKTQIAIELAYRVKVKQPECSVFWIPATNFESLQQAYLEVGRQLQIHGVEEPQADVMRLVQRYLSQESTGRWLLIFDNADDIDMWIGNADNRCSPPRLIDYLPKSSQGSLVFTTRSRKAAVKLTQQNVIEVAEMDEEVAARLLSNCLIDQELLNNHQDTLKLLKQLTFLPLAIVQAAAYINENGITLSDYLSLLEDQEQNVIDLLSEDFEDEGRYRDLKNPVATTWLISFEQIRRRDPLAADYMSFMSCIDPNNVPQSLLPPAESQKRATDAIGTLSAYSFITRRPALKSLDLHRLVHLAIRNWLRTKGLLVEWSARVVTRLVAAFLEVDGQDRAIWRAYLPHAGYFINSNLLLDDTDYGLRLLSIFGHCLLNDGRYAEAEETFSQLLERYKRRLGAEHQSTLNSMNNLALIYMNQGRDKKAEELYIQVVETKKRVLGTEHLDTLISMSNLALTYSNQGQEKEAEGLYLQVIETTKSVLGAEHRYTLMGMNGLASTYANQGRLNEAEGLQTQVLETQKRVLGGEHPSTLINMGNLAATYTNQKRWKEAEELQVQVTQTSRRMLGAEHPDTLLSMNNLAVTYVNQERRKEAEELQVQVMETRKRVLGSEHPDTLHSMAKLASTWTSQGRDNEALILLEECVQLRKQMQGLDRPKTISSKTISLLAELEEWKMEKSSLGRATEEQGGG